MGKRIDGARKLRRGLFYLRLEAFKSLEEFGERAVREWPAGLSAWGWASEREEATMASCAAAAVSRGSSWWGSAIGGRLCAPRSRGLVNPDAGVLIRWP